MAIKSGHGSTLAFTTTSTFSPGYTSFGGFEASRPALDTSVLSTTGARTKIGGDLYDVSEMTNTFYLDPTLLFAAEADSIDDILFDSNAVSAAETITLTLNGGATFVSPNAGGFVTGFALEELTTDQLIAASITVDFGDFPTIAQEV